MCASCSREASPVAWIEAQPAPPQKDAESRAAQLALGSLSDAALADLSRALDDSVARANPLFVNLADDVPALEQQIESHLPTLNAATYLSHARFRTDDGLAVAVGARCADAPPGARCVKLWQKGRDPLENRIRFLAWPFACAVVVRTERAHLTALSAALRDAIDRPGGTIALVVDGQERAAAIRARAGELLSRARKHGANEPPLLSALAANAPLAALLPRGPDEVIVVPRLGALSKLAEFSRELREVTAKLDFPVATVHDAIPLE